MTKTYDYIKVDDIPSLNEAAHYLGVYGMTGWTVEDIKSLRPDWSRARANDFLVCYENRIKDRMSEEGYLILDWLLTTYGDRDSDTDKSESD